MKAVWLLVGCVGCSGGPTFELAQPTAVADAGGVAIDAERDARVDAPDAPVTPDAPRAEIVVADAADDEAAVEADAADAGDAAEADAAEAGVDAGPDAAPDSPSCPTTPAAPFGCGNSGFDMPTQYCVYLSGSGGPDSVVGLPTPAACRCAGAYTCGCLIASPQDLCPSGKTYVGCQTGSTGGVVVNCK